MYVRMFVCMYLNIHDMYICKYIHTYRETRTYIHIKQTRPSTSCILGMSICIGTASQVRFQRMYELIRGRLLGRYLSVHTPAHASNESVWSLQGLRATVDMLVESCYQQA